MSRNHLWSSVIFSAFAALPGSANAEDLRWFSDKYDATTVLVYGVPESDYTPVVFNCETGDDTVRLFVTHDAPRAEDGQQMNVTLSSRAGSVELAATGEFQELDDLFHLEAQPRLDQKLVRILSTGDVLKIAIEGEVQEVPLAGVADQIGSLVAACGAPLTPNDIEFRITNRTTTPIVSLLFSEHGVNDFDGDTYGNRVLLPGESAHVVIENGKPACTFDLIAEFDEDAERDPINGTQNLCEIDEFLVTGE